MCVCEVIVVVEEERRRRKKEEREKRKKKVRQPWGIRQSLSILVRSVAYESEGEGGSASDRPRTATLTPIKAKCILIRSSVMDSAYRVDSLQCESQQSYDLIGQCLLFWSNGTCKILCGLPWSLILTAPFPLFRSDRQVPDWYLLLPRGLALTHQKSKTRNYEDEDHRPIDQSQHVSTNGSHRRACPLPSSHQRGEPTKASAGRFKRYLDIISLLSRG